MSLDLQQLRYLSVVAEEGQITRAAARLHIAQPALSQAISRMEQRLGVVLFTRHARGMTLTPAGVTVLERAREVLIAADDAVRAGESLARAAQDTVSLGFIATPLSLLWPDLLEDFAEACPQCTIRSTELPFPAGATSAWMGHVDAAVCYTPSLTDEFEVRPLRHDGRVLIMSKQHPLAGAGSLSVAQVIDEQFVGFAPEIDPAWRGFWTLDDHRGGPPARRTYDQVSTPMSAMSALSADDTAVMAAGAHASTLMSVLVNHVAIPLADAAPLPFSLIWPRDTPNPVVRRLATADLPHCEPSAGQR